MGAVEILLGVAFPTLFFTALALALATVGPIGFLIARICFCLAALDLIALVTWWLYTSESAGWKLAIGIAIGAIVVGGLPDVLRWVDSNEKKVIALQTSDAGQILSPTQERLLALIAKYQGRFAAAKLIITRNGTLYFDNDITKGKDVNFVMELYGSDDPAKQQNFVSLMEGIPLEYLRFFSEMRFDSPFVVSVTDSGMRYLRGTRL